MKIDRLLSIVMHLLSRDLVSATDLAKRFGVTVRTIQRDVDVINEAGIPITAVHGPSGGYKIMDSFRLDRQFLSFDDIFYITTALKGIGDSLDDVGIKKTEDKIQSLAARSCEGEIRKRAQKFHVDFSALGCSSRRRGYFALIQGALDRNRCLSFEYYDARLAATRRVVEPHVLVFKWFSWYLLAWCRLRKDFRLFRLSRIREPELTHELFKRRPCDVEALLEKWREQGPPGIPITLRFLPELRVLVEDYFSFAETEIESDGRVLARFEMPEDNWLYGLILSYGNGVEVVSPGRLRKKIVELCENTRRIYD